MDILQQLGINWILLLGYFVNFLILFFVLNKFVIKKALANIEKRQEMTKNLVINAEKTKKELEDARKEFNEIVAKAQAQAMEIVGKADENAKRVGEDVTQKAQAQAEEILKRAQENIAKEHSTLKKELEKEIGVLVIETVEKVVGDLPEDQKKKIMTRIDQEFVS